MKIVHSSQISRSHERGSAVIAIMAMIAIMMILMSVNLATIRTVDRELKLVEKKQVQRLQGKTPNHGGAKVSNIHDPSP